MWEGRRGAFRSLTDVFLSIVRLGLGATWKTAVSSTRNIFFYVVRGEIVVNEQAGTHRNLVEFAPEDYAIQIEALEDSLIIFGHAISYQEPVVAQGSFVMNTEQEIKQAYLDYQMGKFGTWKD